MNNFEYLIVLVSVLLALGLAQVMRGLSNLLRSERRHWPSVMWGVALFLSMVQFWWALWDMQRIAVWHQLAFLYVLLIPCTFFVAAETLFPTHRIAQAEPREYFFSIRLWFHGAYLSYHLIAISITWTLIGVPLMHPYRIPQALCASAHVIGLLTARPAVHAWLPFAFITVLVVSQAYFRYFQTGLMPWPIDGK